jgi:Na+(H+)/acetate symporter ActP
MCQGGVGGSTWGSSLGMAVMVGGDAMMVAVVAIHVDSLYSKMKVSIVFKKKEKKKKNKPGVKHIRVSSPCSSFIVIAKNWGLVVVT